jgi:hypothetical protein
MILKVASLGKLDLQLHDNGTSCFVTLPHSMQCSHQEIVFNRLHLYAHVHFNVQTDSSCSHLCSCLSSVPLQESSVCSPSHINGKGGQLVCLCVQCICSCPVAYANGPSGAPAPAPMMDPSIMPEDMADAMDSGADADSSGSGCAPKPVPTQYEAFENVRLFWLKLDLVLIVLAYMALPVGCCHDFYGWSCVVAESCMQKHVYSNAVRHAKLVFALALA